MCFFYETPTPEIYTSGHPLSLHDALPFCLPASGGASLIKTALALHHKVLPPMLCDEPDPALQLETSPFYLNTETRPWVHGKSHPRRAGVNALDRKSTRLNSSH